MPSSSFGHLTNIIETFGLIRPSSILEVGIGFGKYGFLLREYLDLRPGEKGGYAPWQIQLDGIEICEKYLTPVHKYVYNQVYIGNALEILDNLSVKYDCLLTVDVLEHFRKKEAFEFIKKARNRAWDVIICTPYCYYDQGIIFNNPSEAHYSAWTFADFKALGVNYMWKTGLGLIAVFSPNDYPLPRSQEDFFSEADLNNIKTALLMYQDSGQHMECTELAQIYLKYRPDDQDIINFI